MKILYLIIVLTLSQFILGCSTGDLRGFSDALAAANGQDVHYPDQSDTGYAGDVAVTTGVRNGNGFSKVENRGNQYCKLRVTYEDGQYSYYKLDPYEESSSRYMSLYNQITQYRSLCNNSRSVFRESFD